MKTSSARVSWNGSSASSLDGNGGTHPGTRRGRRVAMALLALAPLTLLAARPALAAASVDKLQAFTLDQVQVTDAYQQNLFTKDITYLITTLDSDRLMAGFKAVAAGTNPTNLYGGWENTNIRGHSMGHWMSAVAQAYQQALGSDATLAGQIKAKLDDVVAKMKSYQASNGFLFATPVSQFDDFDAGTGSTWVPYYTMHKILAGLIDIYKYEQNADALTVASKLGDWLYNRAQGWSASAKTRVLSQEYGGLNDALYELYKYTNSANHLTVAHIFDDTGLFTTLAAGTDSLNGLHANMTIPKFIGALNRYRTMGTSEQSYFNAADGFLSVVLKDHTYVTGGHGEDEHFHQPGKLDAIRDNLNNESCNAYNMSKLARGLFMVTGDIKYADYYERVHINEVLSAMNPSTGMTTYFKPMGTGYFKAYGTPDSTFWCCNGTGMENYTKLGDSLYFHDATDLYVIGYVSSTLKWADRGLSLTQTTDLPASPNVTFNIDAAPADAVNIKLRKPYWLASCQSMTVTVNGQAVNATDANGFLAVSRVWQAGDKIQVTLPMEVQVSRLPDNQNVVAFTYGPIVLSAGLGTAQMTTAPHAAVIMATMPAGLQDTITINSGTGINTWLANITTNLVQTPGKLEFTPKGTDSDSKLTFIPHYSRYQDRYGIYWKLAGTAGGSVPDAGVCPAGTGGAPGAGGATTVGTGGGVGSGGATGTAGRGGSAGATVVIGDAGAGGAGAGGATGGGGAQGSGGNTGNGGASGAGSQGSGGAIAALGGSTSGSAGRSGGAASGSGGNSGSAAGGSAGGSSAGGGQGSSGCSCSLGSAGSRAPAGLGLLLGLALILGRRRGRRG